jgi:carboxyl-terminal processing protease
MKKLILGMVIGFVYATTLLPASQAALFQSCGEAELFCDALIRVRANYVHEINSPELIEAAINGMMTALDPHSRVETHKIHHTIAATRQIEARKFRASLS